MNVERVSIRTNKKHGKAVNTSLLQALMQQALDFDIMHVNMPTN